MKKTLLIIAVGLFVFNANAQKVDFGVKAGVNFATVTGDLEEAKSRTAFHIGAIVEIPISEKFSVQPEILYSGQGLKDDEDLETKFDYLNIPVMAKFYVAEGFSLELGPQIGFLLSAETEIAGEFVDIKDLIKGTDFGVNFGLGYKMETGLNFGARYNLGLSDLQDFDDGDDDSIKNGVFQISVGYNF